VVLGQKITPLIIVGGVLIIGGAVLVNTARQRTTKDQAEMAVLADE